MKAVAAGLDLSTVLNDISTGLPHYRFQILLQKASELCNEVKALGSVLLAVVEKRDAEGLAVLRSVHEIQLLERVREIRKNQIKEIEETQNGLSISKTSAEQRISTYNTWIETCQNEHEKNRLTKIEEAKEKARKAALLDAEAAHHATIPNASASQSIGVNTGVDNGTTLSTSVGSEIGGANWAQRDLASAADEREEAAGLSFEIESLSILGAHHWRSKEWGLQRDIATKESKQLDSQYNAAEIRKQIAEQELEHHELQIENARAIDDYMRSKFTNEDLYNWMLGQISTVYFQSYQLAYDIAKRAERAYRFELGLTDSDFIKFGYWDSLKKGLLAGEKLQYDLRRMEMAYFDQNKRQYEITKHISLLQLNPGALIALKELGTCTVELPEALFDMDYPGHYMRRIKTVSISIPCVAGPYTSINCTLTLLTNETRVKSMAGEQNGYAKNEEGDDNRFVTNFAAMQSIATSHAQNDSGMFELNFRDERYLPFEGAGVISRWRIELPKDCNAFDFNTISDVILHLKYTAKEGGSALRDTARSALSTLLADVEQKQYPQARLFSLRHEFANEWQRFLKPTAAEGDQIITLLLNKERFPFLFQNKAIIINSVELFFKINGESIRADNLQVTLKGNGTALVTTESNATDKSALSEWNGQQDFLYVRKAINSTNTLDKNNPSLSWGLAAWQGTGNTHVRFDVSAMEDVFLLCHYTIKSEIP